MSSNISPFLGQVKDFLYRALVQSRPDEIPGSVPLFPLTGWGIPAKRMHGYVLADLGLCMGLVKHFWRRSLAISQRTNDFIVKTWRLRFSYHYSYHYVEEHMAFGSNL